MPPKSTENAQIFVAYYRVSTKKQGRSGLGLDAQREAVESFAESRNGRIAATFTETESGKRKDRPELQRALAAARVHRAILVVAKLDRLARNAGFLLSLRDSGVEIVACDMPSMNRLTVGVLAVVAEEEGRAISERTRVALEAAKRRGTRLGTPSNLKNRHRLDGCAVSARNRRDCALRHARDLAPVFEELRVKGMSSLRAMAEALNARRIRTPRGCEWTATGVRRVLAHLQS